MTRPLRIQYEGALYHIISRGNRNEYIFPLSDDKDLFLKLLGEGAERYRVDALAYCVMGNHYHLLIQTNGENLSEFMHFLGSSYASYLARKGWVGHVFAGRYKSITIEKEEYMLTVSRYIHLNPVEAAIVKNPEDYEWSSYAFHIDRRDAPAWLRKNWLVEYLGPGEDQARARYREFVEAGMEMPSNYPYDEVVAQAILGSDEFVDKIRSLVEKDAKCHEVTGRKALAKRFSLDEIYREICGYFVLTDLYVGGQNKSENYMNARKMFIYAAREYTPSSNREIAELLGDISPNSVSHQYSRMKKDLALDRQHPTRIEGYMEKIMSHVRG